MEEEKNTEPKREFKGNLGFIWLIGILVILLGCTVVYTLKLKNENKELKQVPQENIQSIEQETTENIESTKATNIEEKNAVDVIGLNNKFTELSKAAVKAYNTKSSKTIDYDFNNDGKNETIQFKKSGNDGYDEACVDMYYQDKKVDKSIYTGYEEDLRSSNENSNFYIIDLDKSDDLLDVAIAGFEESDDYIYFNIYKNTGKTLKKINYKSNKIVTANNDENYNWEGRFYINSNNEFFELSNVELCFDKVVTNEYYKIENDKAVSKKANLNEIQKETFKVSTDREMIFYINHKEFNEKDYKTYKTFKNEDEIKILDWIDENEIKAEMNGDTIYVFPGHGYLAG